MGNKSPFPTVTKCLNTKKLARYGVVISSINLIFWVIAGIICGATGYDKLLPNWIAWWLVISFIVLFICVVILEGKNLIDGIKNYLK